MSDFTSISRIVVPAEVARSGQDTLRAAGRLGHEALALWIGKEAVPDFFVSRIFVPQQRAVRTEAGTSVHITGAELHRLNVWLHQNAVRVIAQLHSHPTDAYHSEMDDAFAIATVAGSLSIVVPDFAIRPFDIRDCSVHRLETGGRWAELTSDAAARLISVEE
jgi:Prokaryotic homologs of the JAB domain